MTTFLFGYFGDLPSPREKHFTSLIKDTEWSSGKVLLVSGKNKVKKDFTAIKGSPGKFRTFGLL